jgi:hypothetical protein
MAEKAQGVIPSAKKVTAAAAVAVALVLPAAASAFQPSDDRLVLSDDYGKGATIGAMEDLREDLAPADVSGPEVVAEFKRLCLDTDFDAAAHAKAALESDWGFKRREVLLPPIANNKAFEFVDYRSGAAITSLWRGENGKALSGRASMSRLRRGSVTGGVRAKDLPAPQCNLSVATRGMTDAAPLAAALEQALGRPGAKVVLKGSFADGNWNIPAPSGETRRVSFEAVDLNKAIQIVHLTVQTLPGSTP